MQILDSFTTYGRELSLQHTVVYGGVSQYHQVKALRAGVDVLVATPGRLMDLVDQGHIDLRDNARQLRLSTPALPMNEENTSALDLEAEGQLPSSCH